MRLEAKAWTIAEVDGDAPITEVRAQGVDHHAADRHLTGADGSLGQPHEDSELSIAPSGVSRRLPARRLAEEALDIATPEATVSAGIDPECWKPPRIGPGPDGVGVHAQEGRGLRDADESVTAIAAVTG